MDNIFVELQNSIEEGSDLDLTNEDCYRLDNYFDELLKENKQLKANRLELAESIIEFKESLQFVAGCIKENEEDLTLINEICNLSTDIFTNKSERIIKESDNEK